MPFVDLSRLDEREPFPGFHGRFVHSSAMTLAYWDIEAGASLEAHSHPHEQLVNVVEGQFELTIDGDARVLDAGTMAVIPPDALHSGRAITRCRIIDAFYPIREDYR